MPRSAATCAIGRPDSNTRRTARSRSSSEYLRGRAIDGSSPSSRTDHPGFEASVKPSLAHSGTPVCGLRIASNTRRKTSGGEWVDKPNYLSVTVWGALGENCHRYLAKGRPVAIDGRLEWREWEAQDGTRRESVEIVADSVQFLGGAPDANNRDSATPSEPEPVAASGIEDEDDIPF